MRILEGGGIHFLFTSYQQFKTLEGALANSFSLVHFFGRSKRNEHNPKKRGCPFEDTLFLFILISHFDY